MVLDTPGGLHGWRFNEVMKLANKVLVPLQPSVFDIFAARGFLGQLAEHRRALWARGWTRARLRPISCASS